MNVPKNNIISVLVYLERRRSRKFVGELTYNVNKKVYIFEYDKKYLNARLIPLGPELPLSRKKFVSETLFESFADRLPSRENPAYGDYCISEGVDIEETDPFILLTSIGKRGPSSFVFEKKCKRAFCNEEVRAYREELGLTTKEFAVGFAIAEKTLISVEGGLAKGRDIMKRLELYVRFPEVALFEFRRHCAAIHRNKRRLVEQTPMKKIKGESKNSS